MGNCINNINKNISDEKWESDLIERANKINYNLVIDKDRKKFSLWRKNKPLTDDDVWIFKDGHEKEFYTTISMLINIFKFMNN